MPPKYHIKKLGPYWVVWYGKENWPSIYQQVGGRFESFQQVMEYFSHL